MTSFRRGNLQCKLKRRVLLRHFSNYVDCINSFPQSSPCRDTADLVMGDGERLDVAALTVSSAIAIAGLLITIGQFLSQIFGSVEGYRRCQLSVLGAYWSKNNRTTTRWRWTQLRFEVLFTTPEIALVQPTPSSAIFIRDSFDPESSSSPGTDRITPINELVCWIPFLSSIHKEHERLKEGLPPFQSVSMLFERRRSWDSCRQT